MLPNRNRPVSFFLFPIAVHHSLNFFGDCLTVVMCSSFPLHRHEACDPKSFNQILTSFAPYAAQKRSFILWESRNQIQILCSGHSRLPAAFYRWAPSYSTDARFPCALRNQGERPGVFPGKLEHAQFQIKQQKIAKTPGRRIACLFS